MLDSLRLRLLARLEKIAARHATEPGASGEKGDQADAMRVKGNEQLLRGDFEGSEASYRAALELQPDSVKSLNCLAYVLTEQGRLVEAVVYLQRALSLPDEPDLADAHFMLGEINERRNDPERAIHNYRDALRLQPGFTRACASLCGVLFTQQRLAEIRTVLECSVRDCPELPEYRIMLAKACFSGFDVEHGVENLRAAMAMGVQDARLSMDLGANLLRLSQPKEATVQLELAQRLDPELAFEAAYHLGYYHLREGNSQLAGELLEKSVQLKPSYLPAHSLLLMLCSYSPGQTLGGYSYPELAYRYADELPAATQLPSRPKPEGRPIRVGFVSGELRGHPVGYFLLDILAHMDRQHFELWAYSNNPISDDFTALLQAQFNAWHNIRDLDDKTLIQTVRAHSPDILIDLGGHTGDGRLAAFAQRMAPVQVTWLGYWASTGIKAMDYFLADPLCLPKSSKQWFSERVYRLPHTRLCMSAPRVNSVLAAGPCPSVAHGYVNLASFQKASKISREVLTLWTRVLLAVPHSRLRLQGRGVDTPEMREKVRVVMEGAGVDPARIQMFAGDTLEAYLEAHNAVDLLLDTFPYCGGTTTAYALWMGVPTVTLEGDSILSRQGAAMLHLVGLSDCVAQDEDQYVAIAKRLAQDEARRGALRTNLRATALSSPLFNTFAFAQDFQTALQTMAVPNETGLEPQPQ
jgi:predicted O-linked N-acetylglucosamine transferase (SPINDLY family)